MAKELTMKEIWGTLSKIDVDQYTEKKMNLSYLSWARAWMLTVDKFADARYEFHDFDGIPYRKYPDGTGEVVTSVTIGNHTRSMPLPIMNNVMKPITNPNARQVSDSRMRCLVKNLAMGFGLGMSVFAQHDFLPEEEEKQKPVENNQDEKENNAKKYVENMLKTIETFGDDVGKIQGILTTEKNAKVLKRLQEGYPEIYKGFYDVVEKKVKEVEQKTNSQGE